MTQTYREISKSELLNEATARKQEGWQLTQISATFLSGYDLLYTFERDYEMVNLRVFLNEGECIESVSGIYHYAYLYENEMKDLFGIDVRDISVDFQGNLYQMAVKTPFHVKTAEGEGNA